MECTALCRSGLLRRAELVRALSFVHDAVAFCEKALGRRVHLVATLDPPAPSPGGGDAALYRSWFPAIWESTGGGTSVAILCIPAAHCVPRLIVPRVRFLLHAGRGAVVLCSAAVDGGRGGHL